MKIEITCTCLDYVSGLNCFIMFTFYITEAFKAFVNELGIKPTCNGSENKIQIKSVLKHL